MKINELLQTYVNKSYEELLSIAKAALVEVKPYCQAMDTKNNGVMMLLTILMSSVASDGKFSERELQFIGDLTGLSRQNILTVLEVCMSDPTAALLTDAFADKQDANGKAAVCSLVLCVIACDGRITVEENSFIRAIMA